MESALYSTNVDINPACLSWCPYASDNDLLAVGAYQLDETNDRRLGCVYWYNLINDELRGAGSVHVAGVFRLCWICVASEPILVAALTSGHLALIKPRDTSTHLFAKISDSMCLCAAADSPDNPQSFLVGDSSGQLHLYSLETESGIRSWAAHTIPYSDAGAEVWSTAWLEAHCVVSGADDGLLKVWDVRATPSAPSLCNKTHGSGVTWLNTSGGQLLSGSYDEAVRLWDPRALKSPVDDLNLGGGVWQVDVHPTEPDKLLAACMYNGWALLTRTPRLRLLDTGLCDQRHLLYGVSWCHKQRNLATFCWFYDRTVGLFSVQ